MCKYLLNNLYLVILTRLLSFYRLLDLVFVYVMREERWIGLQDRLQLSSKGASGLACVARDQSNCRELVTPRPNRCAPPTVRMEVATTLFGNSGCHRGGGKRGLNFPCEHTGT